MHRACLTVPQVAGAVRVALGKCGRWINGVGGGCFGVKAVRLGVFHLTLVRGPCGLMMGGR